MTDRRPLSYGSLGGAGRVHVRSDGVHVSDEAETDRVHLGKLADGNYGLQVTNPGGTVIIDGTSNMFKIAATGFLSVAGCNGAAGYCVTTVTTDLATGLTTAPAFLGFRGSGSTAETLPLVQFSAATGAPIAQYRMSAGVVNTNQTRVTARWEALNTDLSGQPNNSLYYIVLKEAAL